MEISKDISKLLEDDEKTNKKLLDYIADSQAEFYKKAEKKGYKISKEEKNEYRKMNLSSISKNNQNHEEKKNNLQNQNLFINQKHILEEETQRKELLMNLQNNYDELFNNIINNWKNNKENFEKFFVDISPNIKSMLEVSCVVSNQDNVILIFKFLCNYFNFFKDKLKIIPIEVLSFLYKLNEYEIFSKNPKKINTNNIFNSNTDLIDEKIFCQIFKQFLPNAEIENNQLSVNNNYMYKYFIEYLFHSEFNKFFFTDFLKREDLNYDDFMHFSNYAFNILCKCCSQFIHKNDYNIILTRIFTNKVNKFIADADNLLKQNKSYYLKIIKFIYDKFYEEIFGSLSYMSEIIEKNKLDNDFESFCFCLFKPCEI